MAMLDMEQLVPDAARSVLSQLVDAGFEAYVVGGCMRDALLGLIPHDWDMTTNATPAQMKAAVHLPSVDTGIKHGTVTFIAQGEPIEVTTFRSDGAYSDGRHPDSVSFARTLEEDLARRDFTVNAMAWSPRTGIVDPFGGASDLASGLLRCVGDAPTRLSEDGLRIMRGLRIAATYGFAIEPSTAAAIHQKRNMLEAVSAERIAIELARMMAASDGAHLRAIIDAFSDVIFQILPELAETDGYDQRNPHHDRNLWKHLLDTMAGVEPDTALRLAALLHDVGKPVCRIIDDEGIAHYAGHPQASASLARTMLRRLKFPRKTIDEVAALIERHDDWPALTPKAARRFLVRCGSEEAARKTLALMRADRNAQAPLPGTHNAAAFDAFEALLDEALAAQTALSVADLQISGRDLIERGWQPGPELGTELARLFDLVIAGELPNERAALLAASEPAPDCI